MRVVCLIVKGISILSLNVCGLKSKLKVPEVINLCKSHDLLCFSEIRCDKIDMQNVKESFYSIGFEVFYRVRSKISLQKSGGIMIAAKSELKHYLKLIHGISESYLSLILDKACLGLDKHVITVLCLSTSHQVILDIQV